RLHLAPNEGLKTTDWSLPGLTPASRLQVSSSAKADDPVLRGASRNLACRGVLDTPPSRGRTVNKVRKNLRADYCRIQTGPVGIVFLDFPGSIPLLHRFSRLMAFSPSSNG